MKSFASSEILITSSWKLNSKAVIRSKIFSRGSVEEVSKGDRTNNNSYVIIPKHQRSRLSSYSSLFSISGAKSANKI